MTGRWARWGLAAGAVVMAASIVSFIWGVAVAQKDLSKAGAIFGAIQALVSVLALLAGGAALVTTLGPYVQWRREQFGTADLHTIVAAGVDVERRLQPFDDLHATSVGDVLLSVSFSNQSDFNVRGAMLNVVVPSACRIQRYPVGDKDDRLRLSPVISTNSHIIPGRTIEVRYLFALLDLMTPHNWYTIPMQINLPGSGCWPVIINLSTPNGDLTRSIELVYSDPVSKAILPIDVVDVETAPSPATEVFTTTN